MKPWYCKTKGVEPQRAQDLLDLACDNGANTGEALKAVAHVISTQ